MKKIFVITIFVLLGINCFSQYYTTQETNNSVTVIEVLAGIIALISIITFFVMAKALQNISISVRNTNRIISEWSKETGIGYIKPEEPPLVEKPKYQSLKYDTNKGKLEVQSTLESGFRIGDLAFIDGKVAPDGKYKLGFMWSLIIKDGKIIQ